MSAGEHHCSRCDRWLDRGSFGSDKQRADGRKAWCRQCKSETGKAYKAKNRERVRAYNAAYERRERLKVNARKRAYRAANPHVPKAADKRWRERHPDRVIAKNAKRRGAIVERVDYVAIWRSSDGRCGICREPIFVYDQIHFDHIITIARGGLHAANNVQVSHALCNLRKGAKVA